MSDLLKITAIKQQTKRKDRYSIFVDGKYAFSLSESALLEQRLASGQELDKARLREFKKLSADDKAYGNTLRWVAMRTRSEGELRQYFRRKQIEEPAAEQITKKSVKVEISRRSSTTISSAFLSEARVAAVFANSSGVIGSLLDIDIRGG